MLDHEKQQLFDAMLEQVGTEIENDELRIELQKSQDETLIAHALGQNKANRALELTKEAEAREMVAHSDRVKTARELEERHAKEMAAANEAAKVTTEAAIKAVTKPVGILLSELIAKRLNKIRATTTQKKTYAVWYEQLLDVNPFGAALY